MKPTIMLERKHERSFLYQWDVNMRMALVGIPTGTQIDFVGPNDDGGTALAVKAYEEDGIAYANIPNILLQTPGSLTVYVYVVEETSSYTTISERFYIAPREKPADYVYEETEIITWHSLDKRISDLEGGGTILPKVTDADNGKVLMVVNERWVAEDLPKYNGAYEVTPLANEETVLNTAQTFMSGDVTVRQIPYYETSNETGGDTVYIGTEV